MEISLLIGVIFLELLVPAFASVAFLLFVRSYLRTRESHHALFAFAFASLFAAFIFSFIGKVTAAYGYLPDAGQLMRIGRVWMVAFAAFATVALLPHRLGEHPWTKAFAASCAAAAASLAFWAYGDVTIDLYREAAQTRVDPVMSWFFALCCAVPAILLLLLAAKRHAAARAAKSAERVSVAYLAAGCSLLAVVALLSLHLLLIMPEMVYGSYAFMTIATFCMTVAVLADDDRDPAVKRHPLAVFRRSLLLKAVGMAGAVMLLASFGVHAVVSTTFVRQTESARDDLLRRELRYAVGEYDDFALQLLEDAVRMASDPAIVEALGPDRDRSVATERLRAATDAIARQRLGTRDVAVIEVGTGPTPSMTVVFSTVPGDLGHLRGSRLVARALNGSRSVGVEVGADGASVVRAAVPILRDDPATLVVVMEAPVAAAFIGQGAALPEGVTGRGLVLTDGSVAFDDGEPLDRLAARFVQEGGGGGSVVSVSYGDGTMLMDDVIAADGSSIGMYYMYVPDSYRDARTYRTVALISFLVMTAAFVSVAIVLLGVTYALRPIRDLRRAAEGVAAERYDVRVKYDGIDELGQLAAAFGRMQDVIAHRTDQLRTALHEQQNFIDHTSRELRNPINIFRWTLELMRFGDTGRLNKDQLELLEQLHQTNERLSKMVQNLQDAIKIDRGNMQLTFGPVVVDDLVDEAAGSLAVQMRSKGISFHWRRHVTSFPPARADRGNLAKVVLDLIGNAVKYTPKEGHIEVVTEVVEESSPGGRKGKFIRVSVEDNGMGIPAADQPKVFRRFQRGRNAVKAEMAGAGLGLYIAKSIVELHGGDMWFASREGIGSTFSFTVPVDELAAHGRAERA